MYFLGVWATISIPKRIWKIYYLFFSCRIDPYLYGKFLFIQCWFVRSTIWGILNFWAIMTFSRKNKLWFLFWTQFIYFWKIERLILIKFLATIFLLLRLIFLDSILLCKHGKVDKKVASLCWNSKILGQRL